MQRICRQPIGLLRTVASLIIAALLGGCPSDDPPKLVVPPVPPTISGVVSADGGPLPDVLVTVTGTTGMTRETRTDANGFYSVPAIELTPPYVVEASYVFHAAVLQAGTANVTPLTELAFQEIVRQDTHLYFLNLNFIINDLGEVGDDSSDITLINAASLAEGESNALRFMRSIYGVIPAPGLGNLFTSSFRAVPGDPMADTIRAYTDAVAAAGISFSIAQQDLLCDVANTVITRSGEPVDFCPLSVTSGPDGGNVATTVYEFRTQSQDLIVVKAQDVQVLSIDYTPRAGNTFSCAGAACANVVLGPQQADGNRSLTFSNTVLTDTTGATASAQGELIAGLVFPPLVCNGEPFYFRQNGSYTGGDCVSSPLIVPSFGRTIYTLPATGTVGTLEVRLDGDRIASILHFGLDENFVPVALFKCRFEDCANLSVSEADADGNRVLMLNGTSLQKVLPDGSFSATETEQVNARLTLTAATPVPDPEPCPEVPVGLFTVDITNFGPYSLCVLDGSGRYGQAFEDGSIDYFFGNYYGLFTRAVDSDVQSVIFDQFFRCDGESCSGTTVSAVDPVSGTRRIDFVDQLLVEIETGGLIGDRTAVLNGSGETTSKNCILNGVCP